MSVAVLGERFRIRVTLKLTYNSLSGKRHFFVALLL